MGDLRQEGLGNGVAIVNDYIVDVNRGRFPNFSTQLKFGRNPAVAADEEVIWDAGGDYEFLTGNELLSVVSTSAEDTNVTGTGAHQVRIEGLDINHQPLSELVDMAGLTPVQTTGLFLRVNRAYVECGAERSPVVDPANKGDITITSVSTAKTMAKILTGVGQTLMCVYTIPAGKHAFLLNVMGSVGSGKQAIFKLKFREYAQGTECVFRTRLVLELFETAINMPILSKQRFGAKDDIVITGQLDLAPAVSISSFFELLLIDENGYLGE